MFSNFIFQFVLWVVDKKLFHLSFQNPVLYLKAVVFFFFFFFLFLVVVGAVPVVIGAPNIQEFAPSPASLLHIRKLSDVESVANSMKYLAANPEAFNNSLR